MLYKDMKPFLTPIYVSRIPTHLYHLYHTVKLLTLDEPYGVGIPETVKESRLCLAGVERQHDIGIRILRIIDSDFTK